MDPSAAPQDDMGRCASGWQGLPQDDMGCAVPFQHPLLDKTSEGFCDAADWCDVSGEAYFVRELETSRQDGASQETAVSSCYAVRRTA